MTNNTWTMTADSLAMVKIDVCKWALDIADNREDRVFSNLEKVLSAAVLLDNRGFNITVSSLIDGMKWECGHDECAKQIQKAVDQHLLYAIEWQDRYLLDYVAMLPYSHGLGVDVFKSATYPTKEKKE